MGYFDFLVAPGKTPPPEARFLYTLDMVWTDNPDKDAPTPEERYGQLKTAEDRVVHKVVKPDRGKFRFEFVDEPGVEYTCSYSWAFVPDTPEHRELYRQRTEIRKQIDELERQAKVLTNQLDVLKAAEKPKVAEVELPDGTDVLDVRILPGEIGMTIANLKGITKTSFKVGDPDA